MRYFDAWRLLFKVQYLEISRTIQNAKDSCPRNMFWNYGGTFLLLLTYQQFINENGLAYLHTQYSIMEISCKIVNKSQPRLFRWPSLETFARRSPLSWRWTRRTAGSRPGPSACEWRTARRYGRCTCRRIRPTNELLSKNKEMGSSSNF